MILTQILIYTIYNTICDSNVVVHRFIRKALHSLTGTRVISALSVRIETTVIVFKDSIEPYWSLKSTKMYALCVDMLSSCLKSRTYNTVEIGLYV